MAADAATASRCGVSDQRVVEGVADDLQVRQQAVHGRGRRIGDHRVRAARLIACATPRSRFIVTVWVRVALLAACAGLGAPRPASRPESVETRRRATRCSSVRAPRAMWPTGRHRAHIRRRCVSLRPRRSSASLTSWTHARPGRGPVGRGGAPGRGGLPDGPHAGRRELPPPRRRPSRSPLGANGASRSRGWNGWGNGASQIGVSNRPSQAGLAAADVPKLPVEVGVRVSRACSRRGPSRPWSADGCSAASEAWRRLRARRSARGCTHWVYRARAAVRTAMTVARYRPPVRAPRAMRATLATGAPTAYAVDADTGGVALGRGRLDEHPTSSITGAPAVHDGRVFVPVSAAGEEVRGGRLDYGCCTFRGSVRRSTPRRAPSSGRPTAFPTHPPSRLRTANGVPLFGPAGAGIWGAPTIDARRGVLYVGTGNSYADPPQPTSERPSIAVDLRDGASAG